MDKSEEYMLAGLIQDFGNNVVAAGTKKKDRKFAKEQSELSYQRSMEHWNEVNAYNTPQSQMERFKQAGLNPNLIYGDMANSPSTHSVEYQPAKESSALPGMRTDPSKYLQAGIQQDVLNQQIKYQTQMMEQTVRMNEHQIQRMEIQNTNMEADTGNKLQTTKIKILETLAKSLGIAYDYGKDPEGKSIMQGNARQWGMKDYDLQAKELSNHQLENNIIAQIQEMSLREKQIWWSSEKNRLMRLFGQNIDKDSSIERKIIKIFEGFK